MNRKKKCLISALTCAMLLASSWSPVIAATADANSEQETIRASYITDEYGLVSEVVTENGVIFSNDVASNLIPEAATVNELYLSNASGIFYVDYVSDGVRTIEEHLPDGSIRVTTQNGDSLQVTYNGETQVFESSKTSTQMDESTLQQIKEAVENGTPLSDISGIDITERNGTTFIRSSNVASRASARSYTPIIIDLEDFFPSYSAKQVKSSREYYSSLNAYRATYVYQTQDFYAETGGDWGDYLIGTLISVISLDFNLPANAVEAVLRLHDVITSGGALSENISFCGSCSYEYWFANEGGVYDTTYHNSIVEVYSEQDWGTFEYGLRSNNDFEWYRKASDLPFTLNADLNAIIDETVNVYNNAIETYGHWRWGPGNFGS